MCEINRINAWLQANVSPLLATYHRKFNSHRVAKIWKIKKKCGGKIIRSICTYSQGRKLQKLLHTLAAKRR